MKLKYSKKTRIYPIMFFVCNAAKPGSIGLRFFGYVKDLTMFCDIIMEKLGLFCYIKLNKMP